MAEQLMASDNVDRSEYARRRAGTFGISDVEDGGKSKEEDNLKPGQKRDNTNVEPIGTLETLKAGFDASTGTLKTDCNSVVGTKSSMGDFTRSRAFTDDFDDAHAREVAASKADTVVASLVDCERFQHVCAQVLSDKLDPIDPDATKQTVTEAFERSPLMLYLAMTDRDQIAYHLSVWKSEGLDRNQIEALTDDFGFMRALSILSSLESPLVYIFSFLGCICLLAICVCALAKLGAQSGIVLSTLGFFVINFLQFKLYVALPWLLWSFDEDANGIKGHGNGKTGITGILVGLALGLRSKISDGFAQDLSAEDEEETANVRNNERPHSRPHSRSQGSTARGRGRHGRRGSFHSSIDGLGRIRRMSLGTGSHNSVLPGLTDASINTKQRHQQMRALRLIDFCASGKVWQSGRKYRIVVTIFSVVCYLVCAVIGTYGIVNTIVILARRFSRLPASQDVVMPAVEISLYAGALVHILVYTAFGVQSVWKMLIMTAHALTIIEHFTRLVSSVRFDHPRDAYSGAIVFSRLLKTCTDLSTSFSEEIVYILDAVVVFQVLTVGAYFSGYAAGNSGCVPGWMVFSLGFTLFFHLVNLSAIAAMNIFLNRTSRVFKLHALAAASRVRFGDKMARGIERVCSDLAALNKMVCKYHGIPVTPRVMAYIWVEFGLVFFVTASSLYAFSSAFSHRFLLCGADEQTLFDWGGNATQT